MAKLLTTGSEGIQDYLERYPAYAETNSWELVWRKFSTGNFENLCKKYFYYTGQSSLGSGSLEPIANKEISLRLIS